MCPPEGKTFLVTLSAGYDITLAGCAGVTQVAAVGRLNCDDARMVSWVLIGLVVLLAVVSWADARNRASLPKRSWNLWIGPKPKEGEAQARYTLRRALTALVTLVVLIIPLFFASPPPDEGTSFSGNESMLGMTIFMVFAPLVAMTIIALVATLFSSLVSAVFRRNHVFDSAAGEFVRR